MTILHYSINDLLEARVKLPIEGKNINGRKIKVYIKNDDEKLKVAEFISMIPAFKIGSISIETETYMKSFKTKVIIELRDMTIFIKHQYQTHPNYLTKNNIIWNDLIFNIIIKLLALNIKCGIEFKFNTTKLTTSLYYCKNVHTDHSKELLRIIYYWGFENVTEIQLTELNLAIKIAKAMNEVHPYIEAKERIYLIENQIKTKKYLPVIEDYINKLQQ